MLMRFRLWMLVMLLVLAACNPNSDSEEKIETPSLREYTPESIQQFSAVIHPAIIATPESHLPALNITPPDCRETATQTLVCLGWVQNSLEAAYINVSLSIDLRAANGQILDTQTGMIARDWLPIRSGAPYRVTFSQAPDRSVTPMVKLLSADPANNSAPMLAVDVQNVRADSIAAPTTDSAYQVTGEIVNNLAERVAPVSVVVTLRNEEGGVAAFRIVQLDQLIPGTHQTFETTLISEGLIADQIEVTADGYRRE